ncbi:FCD domain-containing protein [Saccharopolyspora pogona]|uniref:FCD domain-containing protein n=1 Tax=Saccharopolyspora pogona TaxID=333966 RepID=UPI001683AC90|nr:FCD domain-containing protein [Saccharopolyspora pogona]
MTEAVSGGRLSVRSPPQRAHRRIRTSLVTGRISPNQIYSAQAVAAERLLDNVARLRDQTRLFGTVALAHEGGLRHAADQHRDLLNAVLDGDVLRTEQLMRDHVAYTRRVLGPHQPTS